MAIARRFALRNTSRAKNARKWSRSSVVTMSDSTLKLNTLHSFVETYHVIMWWIVFSARLPWCSSVCLYTTGVHCDHTVHVSADLSLWLDGPMFWTPWHQKCPPTPGRFLQFHLEEMCGMDVQTSRDISRTVEVKLLVSANIEVIYAASIGTTTDDHEWYRMAVHPHRALSLL